MLLSGNLCQFEGEKNPRLANLMTDLETESNYSLRQENHVCVFFTWISIIFTFSRRSGYYQSPKTFCAFHIHVA